MADRFVILGTGGHARAVLNWLSPAPAHTRMTADDEDVRDGERVLIGLGDVCNRKRLYERYKGRIPFRGRQIMRGALIDPGAVLGANVLVNTGAQIDHDCAIGDHCVIAPGAVLCGAVSLGECCVIGAGAIIVQGVSLEPGTLVHAGTLVVGPGDMRRPVRLLPDGRPAPAMGA